MIRPILYYGCTLFDNCSQNVSELLDGLQNKAAIIYFVALIYTCHEKDFWLNMGEKHPYPKKILQIAAFIQNNKHNTPVYLNVLAPNNLLTHTAPLRNYQELREIQNRTNRYYGSFVRSTITLWNDLLPKNSPSLSQFKQKL